MQQNLQPRNDEVQSFFDGGVGCQAKGLLVIPKDRAFVEVSFLGSPVAGVQIGLADEPTTGLGFVQRLNRNEVLVARDKLFGLEHPEGVKAALGDG